MAAPKKLRQLSDLKPAPRNVNRGTPRAAALLDASLEDFGFGRPILADRQGRILAGGQTLKAVLRKAKALGFDLKVVQSSGRAVIVHQREDLAADEATAKGLALADNRIAQLGFDVDAEVLADMLAEGVAVKEFYFDDELARILKTPLGLDGAAPAEPPPEEESPELPGGVRVVNLAFTRETWEEFAGLVEELSKRYGSTNTSETLLEALRRVDARAPA